MSEPTPTPEATPAPPKRRRRRWILGLLLGLPILAIALVLLLVTTDPGLEIIRGIAESAANDALRGEVKIGALEGSALSALTVRDLEVRDPEGRPAVTLSRLHLDWRPQALLQGEIHVEAVELERPRVLVVTSTAGPSNLERLVPPSEAAPEPSSEPPLPLDLPSIRVDAVRITDGGVDLQQGDDVTRIDALTLDVGARAGGPDAEVQLRHLGARLLERHQLEVSALARVAGERAEVDRLDVELDGARLEARAVRAELPIGELSGQLGLRLPEGLAARLGGPEALVAGLELDLSVARGEAPRWSTVGRGTLAGAPLSLSATVSEDLSDVRLALALDDLDPRGVHTEAPEGRLDLRLEASGDVSTPVAPELDVELTIAGDVQPPGAARVHTPGLTLQSNLTARRAQAALRGRIADATISVDADVGAPLGDPRLRDARVELSVPDLGALVGPQAAGRVTLTATASGPLDRLDAEGTLVARGLRWGEDVRVDAVDADWDLEDVPAAPAGAAQLRIGRIRAAGRPIEGLTAAIVATQDEGTTRVQVETLRLETGELVWRGGGARLELTPSGALELQGLGLASEAGELRLSAAADGDDAQAKLQLTALDLAALPRTLVPELGALAGRVHADVTLRRSGPQLRARASVTGRQIQAEPAHPKLDLDAGLRLAPGRLVVTATAGSEALGTVVAHARTTPPARMDSGPAWAKTLSRAPLQAARVELRDLRLAVAQTFAAQQILESGTLRGLVTVDGGAHTARANLRIVDLKSPEHPERGDVRVAAGFDPGVAWTHGALLGGPLGRGTFTATAAAPGRLFDAEAWGRMGPRAVREAKVHIDRLELEVLDDLGVAPGLSGRLDARVEVAPRLEWVFADVQVADVRTPQVEGAISGRTTVDLSSRRAVHALSVALDGNEVITSSVSAALGIDELLQGGPKDIEGVKFTAQADVHALPLSYCAPMAGLDPSLMQGSLTASISASGPLGDPEGDATMSISGLALANTTFRIVQARAGARSGEVSASARLEDGAGGGLDLSAKLSRRTNDIQARLVADGLDLSSLSKLGMLPVGLDTRLFADVTVDGVAKRPRPRGWIEARDLRVVFAQAALQPLHDGKARVEIEPEVARLTVAAASGGGQVDVSAEARFAPETPVEFQATTKLKTFPVAAGSLVRIDLTAEARGKATPEGTEVQVDLTDGFVHVPDEETETLHPIAELEDVVYVDRLPGGTGGEPVVTATRAVGPPTVVRIRSLTPIDVRGGPLDAALATEIDATSQGGRAGLSGRAYTTEGAITLFRRRYLIERAQLTFEGKDPPNPRVDVRLRHEFDDLSFQVRVRGRADAPKVEFLASPARYSQPELLTIFLGTDPEELGQKDDRTVEQQAVGAIAGFVVGKLQDELGDNLPIDTLDIELGDTTQGGAGTRVTLGKWITRKLFLAYRHKFEADTEFENDNEALVQYRFLPGWMVEVVLGLTRNDADLLWTKRF